MYVFLTHPREVEEHLLFHKQSIPYLSNRLCKEMYKADEKKAFEDMLAEISDDSEDDFTGAVGGGGAKNGPGTSSSRQATISPAKPSKASFSHAASADSKSTHYQSGNNGGASSVSRVSQQQQQHKMSKEEEAIENFGIQNSTDALMEVQAEQLNVTKRWLTRPVAIGTKNTMLCFVERERSSFGMATTYRCYLEGIGSPEQLYSGAKPSSENEGSGKSGARFMMSAKKKVANKTSYYLVSIDKSPNDDRGSETVLGKVRGNTIGSRYLITDHGLAPDKTVALSTLRKVSQIEAVC